MLPVGNVYRIAASATPRLARDARRETVLMAAGAEFARRGYEAARIEDIAAGAGVTKPIVYRHFASKKALYIALLERHERDLPSFVADAAGATVDVPVKAILEVWLDYVRANSHAWLMLFRDYTADAEIQAVRARVSETARNVMTAFVRGRRTDLSEPDLDATAEFVVSGLAGLALWWIDRPDTPKPVVLSAATRLCEPALAPQRPTAPKKDAAG